jgi:hypothetical protein
MATVSDRAMNRLLGGAETVSICMGTTLELVHSVAFVGAEEDADSELTAAAKRARGYVALDFPEKPIGQTVSLMFASVMAASGIEARKLFALSPVIEWLGLVPGRSTPAMR